MPSPRSTPTTCHPVLRQCGRRTPSPRRHSGEAALARDPIPIVKRIQDVEGEYDHALPAHALIEHQPEFFESLAPESVENFATLFGLLNKSADS